MKVKIFNSASYFEEIAIDLVKNKNVIIQWIDELVRGVMEELK